MLSGIIPPGIDMQADVADALFPRGKAGFSREHGGIENDVHPRPPLQLAK